MAKSKNIVLLAADDELVADCIQVIVQTERFRLIVTQNCKEVLKSISKNGVPLLLLVDLTMPTAAGWQLLSLSARHPLLSKVPLIALSSLHAADATGAWYGRVQLWRKPLSTRQLAEALYAVLELERMSSSVH